MNKNLKEKILELRNQGLSYSQIKETLRCSKSTISFHCGEGQKKKQLIRQSKLRKKNPLRKKIENFLRNKKYNNRAIVKGYSFQFALERLKIKTWNFVKINKKKGYLERMFNETDLLNKIGTSPKCYLTGRSIDLTESTSYALDHIVPKSKGGNNSLDNCEIACIKANQAKHNMDYEEFVQLCRDVVNQYEKNKSSRSDLNRQGLSRPGGF